MFNVGNWWSLSRNFSCQIGKSSCKLKAELHPLHIPLAWPRVSFCIRRKGPSLDNTDPRRGQRPPVLCWLNWWSDIRGHIWPDGEQAGWEWQHAPRPPAGDGWLTAEAEVTTCHMDNGEKGRFRLCDFSTRTLYLEFFLFLWWASNYFGELVSLRFGWGK